MMVQDTSLKAYREVIEPNLSTLCDKVYGALVDNGPMTQEELHNFCAERYGDVVWSTYRSRIADLQKRGLVERIGKKQSDGGREHIIWRAVRGSDTKAPPQGTKLKTLSVALAEIYKNSLCSWSKTVAYNALKSTDLLKILNSEGASHVLEKESATD